MQPVMDRGSTSLAAAVALEIVPAALLNFAVAFAAANALSHAGLSHVAGPGSVACGLIAFVFAWLAIRSFGRPDRMPIPRFEAAPFEIEMVDPVAEDELLLSEPVDAGEDDPGGELVLEDKLEEAASGSRVVSLFGPAAAPTAGQVQQRIEQHLCSRDPAARFPDATQELHEALAALRQSLS